MKKTFTQKQIPTLLGMLILVAALVGGIFFIGQGGGVFAPRATAEETPQKVTPTNIKEDGFTVTFFTEGATSGFVKYGTDPKNLTSQAADDRDQFSGSTGKFNTHQITVHDLQPDTVYYYTLGTTASSKYDNNGQPYSVKTTKKNGALPIAKTIYGNVTTASGSPAAGALVYVTLNGTYQLSALAKDSGSWAVPLANARNTATGEYRAIEPSEILSISVQGNTTSAVSTLSVSVNQAQPVNTIILGQDQSTQPVTGTQAGTPEELTPTVDSPVVDTSATEFTESSDTTSVIADQFPIDTLTTTVVSQETFTDTPTKTTVQVNSFATQTVDTPQPVIQGIATPNVTVSVEIHSEAVINTQVQTDSEGNYQVNLQELQKNLEPGEHTITVSYPDPQDSSKTLTQTKTFVVSSRLIAAISPSPTPYSTNNPFVLESPTPSPTISPSFEPTPTPTPDFPSPTATSSTIAKVSTESSLPKSGSTTTTMLLIIGGLFFIVTGITSYWATARHSEPQELG